MAKTATGIDVGSRSAIALRGAWKGGTFRVSNVAVAENPHGDIASGWAGLRPSFKLRAGRVAVSGRDVNIRYTRVPEVPDWQLRNLMRFEVQEIGDQSGTEVSSDFNLLPRPPEIHGEDVVLLAMTRDTLLEEHEDGLADAGGSLEACSPASIALYNAFVRYGVVQDDVVLIANIGHENTDVALVRGADLLFARNLTGGSKLFDDALVQRLGLDEASAETAKIEHVDLTPGARFSDSRGEKATRAVMGAAGQLTSLLQSAVMFCKTQVKLSGLKLDRVLICGGGAALEGLPQYLSAGMGVPVEVFDAFHVVDTSALAPADADLLGQHEMEAVVALGLATMASDPEAYSLEIVPSALQKKRDFMGGTVWLIAAAVLAVAFLGLRVQHLNSRLDTLEGESKGLRTLAARAKRIHDQTEELVTQNDELSARTQELQGLGGSGEQVARVLAILDEALPRDLWVTRLDSTFAADDQLNVSRSGPKRPILLLRGKAREGISTETALFESLNRALLEGLPGVEINGAPHQGTFDIDLTMFAPPQETAASEDEES